MGPDAGLQDRLKAMPVHAILATTYACNARCAHCSIAAGSCHPETGELDTQAWLDILRQVAAVGVLFVGISGGEALLRPDILTLIKTSEQLGMFVSLATNGLLLSGDTVRDLKHAGLHGILVSIDHSRPEVHDRIRGVSGLFDAAVAGISRAVDAGLDVVLGFTPMKSNHEALEALARLAADLGCVGINISQYMPSGRGTPELDLDPDEWGDLLKRVIQLDRLYKSRLRVQYHDPRLSLFEQFGEGLSTICRAGFSHFYVLPNGDVTPCNMILDYTIGNVRLERLDSLLARFQRDSKMDDRSLLEGACGRCKQKHLCGGCRANALLYTKNIYGADPRCWLNKEAR